MDQCVEDGRKGMPTMKGRGKIVVGGIHHTYDREGTYLSVKVVVEGPMTGL